MLYEVEWKEKAIFRIHDKRLSVVSAIFFLLSHWSLPRQYMNSIECLRKMNYNAFASNGCFFAIVGYKNSKHKLLLLFIMFFDIESPLLYAHCYFLSINFWSKKITEFMLIHYYKAGRQQQPNDFMTQFHVQTINIFLLLIHFFLLIPNFSLPSLVMLCVR
jgi:hypothetical protein